MMGTKSIIITFNIVIKVVGIVPELCVCEERDNLSYDSCHHSRQIPRHPWRGDSP